MDKSKNKSLVITVVLALILLLILTLLGLSFIIALIYVLLGLVLYTNYLKTKKLPNKKFLLVLLVIFIITISLSNSKNKSPKVITTETHEETKILEKESKIIDFRDNQNYGSVWIGAIAEARGTSNWKMHATYTFDVNFKLVDETKTVEKVEITNISANTNLPNGDLKILPYAHVSYSENGGSIPQPIKFEDWNTYGYVYVSDYKNLPSLSNSYSPKICAEDMICDYLDEVGKKGGIMSLRFKYVGVGNTMNPKPEYQSINTMNAAGISSDQLSGTFSWTLNVTLDDGTVETKDYSISVDGSSLDLASSNTSYLPKY